MILVILITALLTFLFLFLGNNTNTNKKQTISNCEGSWSEWIDSSPCTATCANPIGTKEMTQTYTVPSGASDPWCSGLSNNDTQTKTEECTIEPDLCQDYYPYRNANALLLRYINRERALQDVTKDECERTCFDNLICKSYVYCDDFPSRNSSIIYGPNGSNIVGPCLQFDKSKEHIQFLGLAPTTRELLNMSQEELSNITEPVIGGCGLWEMEKPGNNVDIDCEGEWIPEGDCNQPCDGTQTLNSGIQLYRFNVSQWRENNGLECDNVHGQEKYEPCDVGCSPVPCEGSWSAWTECTELCGGTQSRTYSITTPAVGTGIACEAAHGESQSRSCNTQPCGIIDSLDLLYDDNNYGWNTWILHEWINPLNNLFEINKNASISGTLWNTPKLQEIMSQDIFRINVLFEDTQLSESDTRHTARWSLRQYTNGYLRMFLGMENNSPPVFVLRLYMETGKLIVECRIEEHVSIIGKQSYEFLIDKNNRKVITNYNGNITEWIFNDGTEMSTNFLAGRDFNSQAGFSVDEYGRHGEFVIHKLNFNYE